MVPYWLDSQALGTVRQAVIGGSYFRILSARRTSGAWLVALEGITTREEAARLSGCEVEVLRSDLPALEPGEWYAVDLVGLRALDPAGAELGVVTAVTNFGAGDILVVAPAQGEERFVPLLDGVLGEVRPDLGYLIVAPPRID